MTATKKPIADDPKTKRPTPAREIAKLEAYRDEVKASLEAYAARMAERVGRETNESRRETFAKWGSAAKAAVESLDRVDSAIAWQSAYSAPERPADLVPILAGEVALSPEYGGELDPIPFFVAKVRAAMAE